MKQLSNRFGISIIFTIPLLIISMGPMVGMPLPNIVDPTINAFNFSLFATYSDFADNGSKLGIFPEGIQNLI